MECMDAGGAYTEAERMAEHVQAAHSRLMVARDAAKREPAVARLSGEDLDRLDDGSALVGWPTECSTPLSGAGETDDERRFIAACAEVSGALTAAAAGLDAAMLMLRAGNTKQGIVVAGRTLEVIDAHMPEIDAFRSRIEKRLAELLAAREGRA